MAVGKTQQKKKRKKTKNWNLTEQRHIEVGIVTKDVEFVEQNQDFWQKLKTVYICKRFWWAKWGYFSIVPKLSS